MRWRAEKRTADGARDEDSVLPALQELARRALQLGCDPHVAAVEKRAERVQRAAVQPDADRAVESLLLTNGLPTSGQALCPGDGLLSLGKSHTIGISEIEPDRTAEFLRVV